MGSYHRTAAGFLCLFALLLLSACAPGPGGAVTPTPVFTTAPTATPAPVSAPAPTATPAPVSTPAPTATPTPEPTPSLDALLEGLLACDGWSAAYWGVFPGSGPLRLALDAGDCREALRAALTALDWQDGPGEARRLESPREPSLTIQLDSAGGSLNMYSWDDTVVLRFPGGAVFHANGTEGLCRALLELWPGPEVYYFRVGPIPAGDPQQMGQAYAAAFEEVYRAGGAITDFRLDDVTYLRAFSETHDGALFFTLSFAVKPADPGLSAWRGWSTNRVAIDSSGWASYTCLITIMEANGLFADFNYRFPA